MLKPITYILPAHWASYLINGDNSSLGDWEQNQVDNFLKNNALPDAVSCSDAAYFSKYNDAKTLACDVLEYTFLVK